MAETDNNLPASPDELSDYLNPQGDERSGNGQIAERAGAPAGDEKLGPKRRRSAKPNARAILGNIGREFNRIAKKDQLKAWLYLQESLMENVSVLVPETVSLKDLLAACDNVREVLKKEGGNTGDSPAEYVRDWLNAVEPKVEVAN